MTETIVVVGVKKIPHPDIREYHLTVEISGTKIRPFERPLSPEDTPSLGEVGDLGARIVKGILTIPGVTIIVIHPYSIEVIKAEMFDWETIDPQVIRILQKNIGGEFKA